MSDKGWIVGWAAVVCATFMAPRVAMASVVNVALSADTSSNRAALPSFPTSKAVDGDLSFESRWVAPDFGSESNPIWLKVDLGHLYPIQEVGLYIPDGTDPFYFGWYVDYRLYSSPDDISWTQIADGRLITRDDPTDTLVLAGLSAKYLRFDAVGGTHWAHLGEITVLSPEADPVPEPSTLVIWSLLGTLGITVGWRRRRSSAA